MSVDIMLHVTSSESNEGVRSLLGGGGDHSQDSSQAFAIELAKAGKKPVGKRQDHRRLDAGEGSMEKPKAKSNQGADQPRELLYWAQIMSLIQADESVELLTGGSNLPPISAIQGLVGETLGSLGADMESLELEPISLAASIEIQAEEQVALTVERFANGIELSQVAIPGDVMEPTPIAGESTSHWPNDIGMEHQSQASSQVAAGKMGTSNTTLVDTPIEVLRQTDGVRQAAIGETPKGWPLADMVATRYPARQARGIDNETMENSTAKDTPPLEEVPRKLGLDLARLTTSKASAGDLASVDAGSAEQTDVLGSLLSDESHVGNLVDVPGQAVADTEESMALRPMVPSALVESEQDDGLGTRETTTFDAGSRLSPMFDIVRAAEVGQVDTTAFDEAYHYQKATYTDPEGISSSLVHPATAQGLESEEVAMDPGGREVFGQDGSPMVLHGTGPGSSEVSPETNNRRAGSATTVRPDNRQGSPISTRRDSALEDMSSSEDSLQTARRVGEPFAVSMDQGDGAPSGRTKTDEEHVRLKNTDSNSASPEVSGPGVMDSSREVAHHINSKGRQVAPSITPRQVVEQVVKQVQLDATGEYGEIRLQLKPEHLGELQVKIATNNGVVSALFVAESHTVKGLIEAGLPQLKEQLMQQGLNIQDVSVQVGGDPSSGQSHPGGYEFGSTSNYPVRSGGMKSVAVVSGVNRRNWGSTIDFRA